MLFRSFEVLLPDGTLAYTRDGAFKVDSTGRLTTVDGLLLNGGLTIPPGASDLSVAPTGEISGRIGSQTQSLGRFQITRFTNPAGMDSLGRNLLKETAASGAPQQGNPGDTGFGKIVQNYLEMSNVKVAEEMVNLIVAQRAYEVNSKAVQASDEMMGMANNLKR